ncbi:MAG: transposase, partial [bacterium]|nr:transposase [bacterium]
YTNAIAENINSKIQRFIASNQGTRDREFFYFRLAAKFSTPAPQNNILPSIGIIYADAGCNLKPLQP